MYSNIYILIIHMISSLNTIYTKVDPIEIDGIN